MPRQTGYATALAAARKFERMIESTAATALAATRRLQRTLISKKAPGRGVTVKVGKATMKAMKVHETDRYTRYRIRDPKEFDPRSFRIIDPGRPGHTKMIIGCPAGFFRGGKCKVGTVVQAVLKEK